MKNFKIESIAWKWKPEVKRPEIYRPDEFIKTETKKEALEAAEFLLSKPQGTTGIITVKRDDGYFTYYRHSMPCLGFLVRYADSHGKEKYWMNPYFPRDICVAFPEGEIIFIGVYVGNVGNTIKSEYFEFLLSEESPWVAAFGNRKTIIFKDNYLILTNMDADPTVFYSLMRLGGLYGYGGVAKPDWNPKANLLLSKMNQADPRRLAGSKPITFKHSWGKDNQGYVRPYNESIFKTNLPCKLKDFGNLPSTGYPPAAPFTNQYFVSTMKEKFKVDVTAAGANTDKKVHDAILESWIYFKNEAKKLGDE